MSLMTESCQSMFDNAGIDTYWTYGGRRMKMKLAAVTWGTINQEFSVVQCTHYIYCWFYADDKIKNETNIVIIEIQTE